MEDQAPSSLRDRLARQRREGGGARRRKPAQPAAETTIAGELQRGRPADLVRAQNEHGGYAVRERVLSPEHVHGTWSLAEVDHADPGEIARFVRDPALEQLRLRAAIYLDVETTGLAGGAGTTSFMVALGRFEEDGFHLWQGFLEGPEEERAMLTEVARRVAASTGIVSFFGKSFDRHRLEDKMRLHGIAPPFEGLPHLDLYHPLVRLYGRALLNGRLSTMERTLSGVERQNDLPGSYAPEAWFDFLGGRPHRLEAVFQHNADDVLSLVTLAAHLGRVGTEQRADGSELPGPAGARAESWARWHAREGDPGQALQWLTRAFARSAELGCDRALRFFEAGLLRRVGELEAAYDCYMGLAAVEADLTRVEALVEAAKLAEHKRHDLPAALYAVEGALALVNACVHTGQRGRWERELTHRRDRLLRKRSSP